MSYDLEDRNKVSILLGKTVHSVANIVGPASALGEKGVLCVNGRARGQGARPRSGFFLRRNFFSVAAGGGSGGLRRELWTTEVGPCRPKRQTGSDGKWGFTAASKEATVRSPTPPY